MIGSTDVFNAFKALHQATLKTQWKYAARSYQHGKLLTGPGVAAVYVRCYDGGAVYVGETINLPQRDRQHKSGREKATGLQELAAAENGINTRYAVLWSWDTNDMERPDLAKKVLRDRERRWIARACSLADSDAFPAVTSVLNTQGVTGEARLAARRLRRLRAEQWKAETGAAGCVERCMTAQSEECDCVCGGEFHGCFSKWESE